LASAWRGGRGDLVWEARAKINIGLHVGALRPDGYHEIWSILQEINLADRLLLRDAPDFSLSMTCPSDAVPGDESNLCMKAARLLQKLTGCRRGVQIELEKNIPVGAGLGGGSSDAASVLKGLNQLWDLGLTQTELLVTAAKLGSDVPFFILGGCCRATGRGEILQPIASPLHGAILLVTPPVHVSTAWAYKNIDNYSLTYADENIIFEGFPLSGSANPELSRIFRNDFEPLVFSHYPFLGALKDQLMEAGAFFSSLTGSGSSLYAVFHKTEEARQALQRIQMAGNVVLIET
jgi:4-diphosphocytidyl-2-C-methyl-D-erythritol kinase